jgi:hypothetical protein
VPDLIRDMQGWTKDADSEALARVCPVHLAQLTPPPVVRPSLRYWHGGAGFLKAEG